MRTVGTNVARKEGMARATGAALFADDLKFPGVLHGRTVRTGTARGRLIGYKLGFDVAGFTVVDHRDIPGENVIALIVSALGRISIACGMDFPSSQSAACWPIA